MILITGSGRSGTTFLTQLFKELGLQLLPECMAEKETTAGLEGRATDLSLKLCALRGFRYVHSTRRPRWFWNRLIRDNSRAYLGESKSGNYPIRKNPWSSNSMNITPPPELVNEMCELKADVIKSPFALRVLDHWLVIRDDIDLVIFCVRDLNVVAKRWETYIGQKESVSIRELFESYGMAFWALNSVDRKVPYVTVWFPQSVTNGEYLYDKLKEHLKRLGRSINQSEFLKAHQMTIRPDWIND